MAEEVQRKAVLNVNAMNVKLVSGMAEHGMKGGGSRWWAPWATVREKKPSPADCSLTSEDGVADELLKDDSSVGLNWARLGSNDA
jgi:hypothetical protein